MEELNKKKLKENKWTFILSLIILNMEHLDPNYWNDFQVIKDSPTDETTIKLTWIRWMWSWIATES